jgi:hypothetical protein
MADFMQSGRRTRFGPARTAQRETLRQTAEETRSPQVTKAFADAATKLLNDEAFFHVINAIAEDANAKFASSAPGAAGMVERESAHALLYALADIMGRLQAMQDDAKIYEAREGDEEADKTDLD